MSYQIGTAELRDELNQKGCYRREAVTNEAIRHEHLLKTS
jgi:hypothetical protein